MKLFLIERKLPGAGNLTAEELRQLSNTSLATIKSMGSTYCWLESFVTDDAIYCVHAAESEADVREHAARCNIPIHVVEEIRAVIGPNTANTDGH